MHNTGENSPVKTTNRFKRAFLTIMTKFYGAFGRDYGQSKYHTEIVTSEKRDSDLLGEDADDIELNEDISNGYVFTG